MRARSNSRDVREAKRWPLLLASALVRGLLLGVAARMFMRLLSEDPEFTWAGTLLVVGLFTVFGAVQGAVDVIRVRIADRWIIGTARFVGALSYLALGGAAGLTLVPFLWCFALALWRDGWPKWLRAILVFLSVTNLAGVVLLTGTASGARHGAGAALLVAVYVVLAWSVGPTLRPPDKDGGGSPRAHDPKTELFITGRRGIAVLGSSS